MSTTLYIDIIEKIPNEEEKDIYKHYSYDRYPYKEDLSFDKKETSLLVDLFDKIKDENFKQGKYELTKDFEDRPIICLTSKDIDDIIKTIKGIDDTLWTKRRVFQLEELKEYLDDCWITMYWG